MLRATTDLIVERHAGRTLVGAVSDPQGSLALVLDDGSVLVSAGNLYSLAPDECGEVISMAAKRLARQNAELYTVAALLDPPKQTAPMVVEAERMRNERTLAECRTKVPRVLGDDFEFGGGMEFIGTGMGDVQNRARLEAIARETPEV